MGMQNNLMAFNISVEGEAGIILSRFDNDYILNVVQTNLGIRASQIATAGAPNIISALEMQFKLLSDKFPHEANDIALKREDLYKKTIDILCKYHGLSFNYNESIDTIDWYSAAYTLYDFLISNFKMYYVNFFCNYIIKEKTNIYLALNLSEQKKNKDSSTIYGKKTYNNPKMAIIISNIDTVLNYILSMDISFEEIINTIFPDKNDARNVIEMVTCITPFFSSVYAPFLTHEFTRPSTISDIRLELHKYAISNAGAVEK